MLLAGIVTGRKPKVREEDFGPVLIAQDVKGFQVAMVDVVRMAVIHSIDDLEEGGPDARRIASVRGSIVDHIMEATSRAVIEEGGSVITELDVLVQGNDVGVVGEEVMEGALLFPTGGFVHDLQHQLTSIAAVGNAEGSAVAPMSEVLFDVKVVVDLFSQQLKLKLVDVRGDRHDPWWWYCGG